MDLKKQYILRELWILAWNASVQHASLYVQDAWKNRREEINRFKDKIIKYLSDVIIPRYREKADEDQHLKNISELIEFANKVDTGVLGKNRYKYGVAQKLLNLALKYYWCIDEIEEPPHCPIDRIVIEKTKFRGLVNWTQITNESEYLMVVEAIRELASAQGVSISEWELTSYQRR